MPIDPAFLTSGTDWSVALQDTPDAGAPASGASFGGELTKQLQGLADLQNDASKASTELATGTATDPASTVMAVERARLSMQLASTLRTKGIEAVQEIFHTQV